MSHSPWTNTTGCRAVLFALRTCSFSYSVMVFAADVCCSVAIFTLREQSSSHGRPSSNPVIGQCGALGIDPAAHVIGTMRDPNPARLRAGQEPHGRAGNESDLSQVEENRCMRRFADEILQPRGMLGVHLAAQAEDDSV